MCQENCHVLMQWAQQGQSYAEKYQLHIPYMDCQRLQIVWAWLASLQIEFFSSLLWGEPEIVTCFNLSCGYEIQEPW